MSRSHFTFFLLPGLLLLALSATAQTKAVAPATLKPGKSITQTMKGGQSFDYLVALKAGEALKATVVQQGADVVVTAYAPDGTKLGSFDSPTSTVYKEFVTVVAPTTGRYRLAVSSFDANAPVGTFVMTLDGILTPTQYAQSQAEDGRRADAAAAYLQTFHPDLTTYEQRNELLKLDPAALMPKTASQVTAAHWLEGTWNATSKLYSTATEPELTLAARTSTLRFDAKNPNTLLIDPQSAGKFRPLMAFDPLSRQWIQANVNSSENGTYWTLLKGRDWQNSQLVMEGEAADMGIASRQRQTWTKTDDRTVRVVAEEHKADGSWIPVTETVYTRTTPAVVTTK
ncbi:MAG: hypothetical protein JWR44_1154 [Hymenobacter sp.]|jgi:hypothetical protein|nr:hypothetical protein [Hymenobacter sp.]